MKIIYTISDDFHTFLLFIHFTVILEFRFYDFYTTPTVITKETLFLSFAYVILFLNSFILS